MKFINRNNFELTTYRLSAEEYLLKMKEHPKPIVLDIRSEDEYSAGTVQGAYSLPHDEFADRMIQLPPFGSIILYADSANSNIESTLRLLWENGFTDIFYVDGGYEAIMAGLFEISDSDLKALKGFLSTNDKPAIKLEVKAYELGYEYCLDDLDPEEYKRISLSGVPVYFLHRKLKLVAGTKLNWENGKLTVDHPRIHQPRPEGSLKDRVQELLDREINPTVATHGGYVKLLSVEDDVAYIEMTGGCQGCGLSSVTLKNGVEAAIFEHMPEISKVLDTTDHAAGTNPYYEKST